VEPESFKRETADAAMKQFDAGEPLPAVDPDYLRRMWEIMPGLAENKATGLGAIAGGMGVSAEVLQGAPMVALMMRAMLLKALAARGILREYEEGDSMRAEVFRAAATVPCNKEDLAEALVLERLAKLLPEQAESVLQAMRAEGYDPQHPRIDAKFLAGVRETQ
jgi:hypothetical protein